MKSILLIGVLAILSAGANRAEEVDTRSAIGITAGRSVDAAVKRAAKENKRVLVLVVDPTKKAQTFHIKGMMEFEETKNLVKDHFILVVTDFRDKNIRDHVEKESTERPVYVLLNKDGSLVQKGTTAMGGANGNKLVKEWVAGK